MIIPFYSLKCTGCKQQIADIRQGGNHLVLNHNCSGSKRLYTIFQGIKTRCNNKKSNKYSEYGARGIKCDWLSYSQFYNDMEKSYLEHCKKYGERNTTIDRIDTYGNYSKTNCRWATMEVQNNNSRKNRYYKYKDKKMTLYGWSRFYNISVNTLYARTHKLGWGIKKALETPIDKKMIPFQYRNT